MIAVVDIGLSTAGVELEQTGLLLEMNRAAFLGLSMNVCMRDWHDMCVFEDHCCCCWNP